MAPDRSAAGTPAGDGRADPDLVLAEPPRIARRGFLRGLGLAGMSALLFGSLPAALRFLAPRERGASEAALDAGPLVDYRAGTVSTRWVHRHGLWIVRQGGRLFALEARCTHLGCTPRWMPDATLFRCPCHGSRFTTDGVPINGPATRPLARLAIALEDGRVRVDRSRIATLEAAERDPRFYITL
jgi:cytochrome b6-f complex iron-sulfur subunit